MTEERMDSVEALFVVYAFHPFQMRNGRRAFHSSFFWWPKFVE